MGNGAAPGRPNEGSRHRRRESRPLRVRLNYSDLVVVKEILDDVDLYGDDELRVKARVDALIDRFKPGARAAGGA